MSYSTLIGKTVTDTLMSRRTFLKWSAALGGTAVLAQGGLQFGLQKAEAAPHPEPVEGPVAGKWVTAACWHNCGGQQRQTAPPSRFGRCFSGKRPGAKSEQKQLHHEGSDRSCGEPEFGQIHDAERVVANQKHPLADAAHQLAFLAAPLRGVPETIVIGQARLDCIIDYRDINLAVGASTHRYRGTPPREIARPLWRMK